MNKLGCELCVGVVMRSGIRIFNCFHCYKVLRTSNTLFIRYLYVQIIHLRITEPVKLHLGESIEGVENSVRFR